MRRSAVTVSINKEAELGFDLFGSESERLEHLLLKLKVIKLEWVRGLTDFLIANLGFFFVPPGVALMLYFDLIKAEIVPITLATLLSTIIVLLITGQTHQVVNKGEDKVRKKIQTKKNKNIQL